MVLGFTRTHTQSLSLSLSLCLSIGREGSLGIAGASGSR